MKILFIINNMKIGGTRSSLINLLHLLPYEKVEVHLLILSPYGPYLNSIDNRVRIIPTTKICECLFSSSSDLKGINKAGKYFMATLHRLLGDKIVYKLAANSYRKLSYENYDAVIGYQEGDTVDMAASIPGKKHFCWIHNDYTNLGKKHAGLRTSLEKMDKIFFVASAALQSFEKGCPGFEGKTKIIKNTIDVDALVEKSKEKINDNPFGNEKFKLVSMGRVTDQKHYSRVINAAESLVQEGCSFKWIVIGEGNEREQLISKVKDRNLTDYVEFIGARTNPYAYLVKADVLVVTSLYESQPMVILEALTLGVPVISTDFSSAKEILEGKDYAVICDNSDEGVANTVSNILLTDKIDSLKKDASRFQYNNNKWIELFMEEIKC